MKGVYEDLVENDIDIKILITNKSDAGCILRAKKSNISCKIIKNSEYETKEYFEYEIINTKNVVIICNMYGVGSFERCSIRNTPCE